jgi:glycosyltransferase involved in cell wall biosynthesis
LDRISAESLRSCATATNGYLFPSEDAAALSARLRRLLEDAALRLQMGESGYAGYARAHGELNEKTYVREFARMVAAAAARQR